MSRDLLLVGVLALLLGVALVAALAPRHDRWGPAPHTPVVEAPAPECT